MEKRQSISGLEILQLILCVIMAIGLFSGSILLAGAAFIPLLLIVPITQSASPDNKK